MIRLPPHPPGLRVGLYGGSFNPAHAGHRHVSLLALRRLELDRLWWLVTPGNPLKSADGLPPAARRAHAADRVAAHPDIAVTGFEEEVGARYTSETLAWLLRHGAGPRYVWIMGADSLATFHLWRGWRDIAEMVPIAVVDRPGFTLAALNGKAARALAPYRRPQAQASRVVGSTLPAWVFLTGPRSPHSSTAIRQGKLHHGDAGVIEMSGS